MDESFIEMLQKTKGIILRQIKHSDSGIIVQVYTRDFGRQSVMIKGMRAKKSGKHNVFFQPLFIHDLVLYYKESNGIHMLREFNVSHSPAGIYSDISKSCIAVFISEILTVVLKEESSNPELFDYLENSIKYLDSCGQGYANFHIAFLIGLSSLLGFEPGKRDDPGKHYFDLVNGSFTAVAPVHSEYAGPHVSEILAEFFPASFDRMRSIPMSGSDRNEVLDTMIRYFSIHLPGLKKVNSLAVLKEIFS